MGRKRKKEISPEVDAVTTIGNGEDGSKKQKLPPTASAPAVSANGESNQDSAQPATNTTVAAANHHRKYKRGQECPSGWQEYGKSAQKIPRELSAEELSRAERKRLARKRQRRNKAERKRKKKLEEKKLMERVLQENRPKDDTNDNKRDKENQVSDQTAESTVNNDNDTDDNVNEDSSECSRGSTYQTLVQNMDTAQIRKLRIKPLPTKNPYTIIGEGSEPAVLGLSWDVLKTHEERGIVRDHLDQPKYYVDCATTIVTGDGESRNRELLIRVNNALHYPDLIESFVPSHQVSYKGHVLNSGLLVHGDKQNIQSDGGKCIDLFTDGVEIFFQTDKPTKEDFDSLSKFQLTNPRQHTSDEDGSSKSVLFLEEQVKIHEATLRAWRERREAILIEKETALAKKRELIELRTSLIERQATLESAQSKQLVLQAELRESLAMSREKLKRLRMLENEGEKDDDADTGGSLELSEAIRASSDASQDLSEGEGTTENYAAGGQDVLVQNPANNASLMDGNPKKAGLPVVFDSYENAKELSRYHSSTEGRKECSLLGFLPYLDSTQVEEYLTLMQRETYALDQEDDGGKERSLRRQLLQNTCLDVLLLALPNKKKDGMKVFTGAYSDATPQHFDPNLSLCPYELAGICADDLCPYQHTTKVPKILARERLPLPPLPQSFLLVDESTVDAQAERKTKTTLKQRETITEKENLIQKTYPTPARGSSLANDGENMEEEEDFIMLPPSSSPNDNENKNNEEERNEATIDVNEKNTSQEEDLVLLLSPKVDKEDENHETEDGTASNFFCNNPQDPDGEFRKEMFTNGTALTDIEGHTSNTTSFWWGGRTEKMVPKDRRRTQLSILDVLEDTFGLTVHEYPNKMMTGTEVSSSTERRLEIKRSIAPNGEGSNASKNDGIKALGRVIDASRLAIHGGLHDLVISFDQRGLNKTRDTRDESLDEFTNLMIDQTRKSRFFDQFSSSLSCFEDAFATQIGLAILSWSLAAYDKVKDDNRGREHVYRNEIESACESCLDDLRNPNNDAILEQMDTVLLEVYIRNIYFSEVHQEIEPLTIDSAIRKIKELRALILWVRRDLVPRHEELDTLEERLNCVWSVARKYLRKHGEGHEQNGSGDDSAPIINLLDKEFRCLKVAILMGYAISGCLTNFANAAISTRAFENDVLWEDVLGSKPSASSLAAWTLLDGAIARVLKEMRGLVIEFPLLDLVLAPLFAYSVAAASYLRNYSVAQNRLVACLAGNHHRSGDSNNHSSTNLMVYSELLWSQMVQLRMSLPNEPPAMANPSILGSNLIPKGNKLLAKRDSTDDFPWEMSQKLKEDSRQFIAKLRSLDISLRHVVLWGDWMLSSLTEKNGSSQDLLRLFSKTPNESKPGQELTETSIDIQWSSDLGKLFGRPLYSERRAVAKPANDCFGRRCYPPPTPLPRLPLFLLYAGKFLTSLNLEDCHLEKLPFTFGLCFPNLRHMDLSNNDLRELPESFRRLTNRMKFLEVFKASYNKLESLPLDMFSDVSSKQLTVSSPPPLKVLSLSHNKLVSVPSLVGLDHLEVLTLRHNDALVDMSVADWSRLALRLPSLRVLTTPEGGNFVTRAQEAKKGF